MSGGSSQMRLSGFTGTTVLVDAEGYNYYCIIEAVYSHPPTD